MRSVEELSQAIQVDSQRVAGALREAASGDLGTEDLTRLLEVAFTQRNQVEAALTAVVAALDQAAARTPDGEATLGLSCPTWLSHTLRISANAAHAQVHLARALPSLPAAAAAFARGELSPQHASVVVRATEQVTRGGGDPGTAEALLRLSEAFGGGYDVEGYLDPEGGALLKTALNGVVGPRRKGDERTPGQRRADGLVELARRCLDSGELPARGGQRPHLTVTARLETLRADPGAPAALLDWGFPISGRALRRIAGDAEITPILLSEKGDPLHVGRRYRTATPKMRRALAERDRCCIWPGCDRPPEWTQAHHERRPWALGGRTEVDDMGLLCQPHHGRLSRGWRLERLPDRRVVVHPPPPPGRSAGPQFTTSLPDLPGP